MFSSTPETRMLTLMIIAVVALIILGRVIYNRYKKFTTIPLQSAHFMIKSGKLSNDELLEVGRKSGAWTEVATAFDFSEMTIEAMIRLAKEIDDWPMWDAVIERINFEDMTVEEMLGLGMTAKYYKIWQSIVKTDRLSNEQLLDVGKAAENHSVWRIIETKVNEEEMTYEQVCDMGRMMKKCFC